MFRVVEAVGVVAVVWAGAEEVAVVEAAGLASASPVALTSPVFAFGGVTWAGVCVAGVAAPAGGGWTIVLTTGFVPSGAAGGLTAGFDTGGGRGRGSGTAGGLSNPVNATIRRSPLRLATSSVAFSVPTTGGIKETPISHVSFGWIVLPTQLFQGKRNAPASPRSVTESSLRSALKGFVRLTYCAGVSTPARTPVKFSSFVLSRNPGVISRCPETNTAASRAITAAAACALRNFRRPGTRA